MNINQVIADELKIGLHQVDATVELIDGGNTIPFIARYRKEVTGGLNDEVLRNLDERLTYLRNLEEKKASVITTIEGLGMMTDELRVQIEGVMTQVELEDIYRPYRPKRRTRAMIAREKGLLPLAEAIAAESLAQPALEEAKAYVNPEKEVESPEQALAGAMDILAEIAADNADYRRFIRQQTMEEGLLISSLKDAAADPDGVFKMYYEYQEQISKAAVHRILALNRGENLKVLTVKVEAPLRRIMIYLKNKTVLKDNPHTTPVLLEMLEDSYKRLIAPSVEREIRNALTEKAEDSSLKVFGSNLEQLLMQPPIAGHTVLGWDPAFRTGCKLAVIDPTGKVLDTKVIYPTAPQNKVKEAEGELTKLIQKYHITLISVGNGTASRESEQIIADYLKKTRCPAKYVIVNEAGASVYSASKLAAKEFPDFDVAQRSAVSIARRLQDPLAELVKIDPRSIGVGQYQHDMNQKKLGESLGAVVEDCVNRVGVDLNTASASLLEYISGISSAVAKNIVAYREENGRFEDRRQLLKVPKLGPKAYEQCAGFLRINGGKNPLDATAVHPESYKAVEKLAGILGIDTANLTPAGFAGVSRKVRDIKKLAAQLEIGIPTLQDILKELEKPARDPRQDMPAPVLRSDVLSLEDLKEGMVLKGTVRNVIDFGAFVDIGVHQDGLVHISQMTKRYIKHPSEVVKVGDIVDVMVMSVDVKRKRIQLTMKGV
ncbi:MAG: RNA-binding transcriptional accessory protein [Lachnospiraceae bacterium]|nr:RNA-binding transcriptional accessory protein [Lachnospiraceae bacterium]